MVKCELKIGKQFNFLKSMSLQEKEELQKNSSLLKLKKGDVVFFEEENLKNLYSITKGACKFSITDHKGNEHITKLLGVGELMGRRSIITDKGALVTATAVMDSTLLLLNKEILVQSIRSNNAFCQDVLNGFIYDIEDETEKINFFNNNLTVKIRLAGLLLYLSKKFGVDKDGWLKIVLRRQDMANILGTTSEYVISLLSDYKEKEYLKITGRKIKINSEIQLTALL